MVTIVTILVRVFRGYPSRKSNRIIVVTAETAVTVVKTVTMATTETVVINYVPSPLGKEGCTCFAGSPTTTFTMIESRLEHQRGFRRHSLEFANVVLHNRSRNIFNFLGVSVRVEKRNESTVTIPYCTENKYKSKITIFRLTNSCQENNRNKYSRNMINGDSTISLYRFSLIFYTFLSCTIIDLFEKIL